MKILIYAHLFPPSKGGIQFSNLEIIKGLYARGNEIKVIACHNKGIRNYLKKLPFDVVVLPKWHFATMSSVTGKGLWNWVFMPWYAITVRKCIRVFCPEIILVADETANTFWGLWAHKISVPYISYCSVPHIEKWLKESVSNGISRVRRVQLKYLSDCLLNSYLNAKYIISVSRSTKEKLCETIPQIIDRIRIIPRSIDDQFFFAPVEIEKIHKIRQQYGIDKGFHVLLSVSRLSFNKGIDDTIEAIAGLPVQLLNKIKYIIAGDGESLPSLKHMANNLGLDRNTVFIGEISQEELIPFYDMCDLFILPSRRGSSESFGRVFVEAAARSKTSIGVNQGGMIDIIKNGETGCLVAPGDVDAIREKISYLLMNKKWTQEMGRLARLNAEKNYSSFSISRAFEIIFNKVMEENPTN